MPRVGRVILPMSMRLVPPRARMMIMTAGDPNPDMSGRMPTSRRRPGKAQTSQPKPPTPEGVSWVDQVKENVREILMVICVASFYLAVAAYCWRTRHFPLVPISALLALVTAGSFIAWLSPKPPERRWVTWLWVPPTLAMMALGLYTWLQSK